MRNEQTLLLTGQQGPKSDQIMTAFRGRGERQHHAISGGATPRQAGAMHDDWDQAIQQNLQPDAETLSIGVSGFGEHTTLSALTNTRTNRQYDQAAVHVPVHQPIRTRQMAQLYKSVRPGGRAAIVLSGDMQTPTRTLQQEARHCAQTLRNAGWERVMLMHRTGVSTHPGMMLLADRAPLQ